MAEAGRQTRAGQELRLAEIPAGAGLGLFEALHGSEDGAAFARTLDQATRRAYGSAWTPLRFRPESEGFDKFAGVIDRLLNDPEFSGLLPEL
jgi:putative DNA primase/helicase